MENLRWSCKIGGELKGFQPERFLPRSKLRHMPYASQIAVIAAIQASEDAGLDLENEDRDRIGVVIGTAGGSTIQGTEEASIRMVESGFTRASPQNAVRLWPNMTSYYVAEAFQARGKQHHLYGLRFSHSGHR